MQLHSVSIVGLHDALTLEVGFNEEITLLVGINGSGKTSVLNVIDWLLKPDLQKLATTVYKRLSLSFTDKNIRYSITATKTDALVVLVLAGMKTPLKPITINLLQNIELDDEALNKFYARLSPDKNELPMWKLLKSLTKLTVISLDRTISAEADDVEYVETPRGYMQRHGRTRSPLAYVADITSEKYAEFRSNAIANDSELKAQIVFSALQDPDLALDGQSSFKAMNPEQISHLENKVISYLSGTIKSKDIAEQIHSFFSSSRMLAERTHLAHGQQQLLLDFVSSRYRQIESLAKAFNDFETKNAAAFRTLKEYLDSTNRFLSDSKKELHFDESTGQLVFSFSDSSVRRGVKRKINHLSSGEKQILILFTFLAFASRSDSVFIVDEPELSLHPKWQHEFMEEFLSLRPQGSQLILATHSPDIVGRFKSACVTLRCSK